MTCEDVVRRVRDTIREVRERVRSEIAPLTTEQLRWRPSPERWGVGECLVHLRVVGEHAIPGIEAALHRARERGLRRPEAPYRSGWFGRRVIEAMAPDSGLAVRTGRRFRPGVIGDRVVPEYLDHLDRSERLLDGAAGLDLSAVRAPSPSSRLIRLRVADLLLLMANHERRHLRQALAVVADPGFPGRSAGVPSP